MNSVLEIRIREACGKCATHALQAEVLSHCQSEVPRLSSAWRRFKRGFAQLIRREILSLQCIALSFPVRCS